MNVTERELEDFKRNPVWIEMQRTLVERRQGYLEDLAVTVDVEDIRKIQGCITELDYQLQQPEFILMDIEGKKEDTEPESGSGKTG